MKQTVTVSAPGKLMLFGEHAVVYGKPCIVTAVDQRLSLVATITKSEEFVFDAPDVNVRGYKKHIGKLGKTTIPKGAQFVEIAVKNVFRKYKIQSGLQIRTKSEFASTFGFGSSSASAVCTVKALSELFDLKLSSKELFELSYETVLQVQGKGSGFDVAAAIYGGTLYFVTGGKIIQPLIVNNIPLVIGYTGIKADTVDIINKVSELAKENPSLVESVYQNIAGIVEDARIALEKEDFAEAGRLMNENQKLLIKLLVSCEKLDQMIDAAVSAGAYGAKLSGAGSGDCMIALASEEKMKSIKNAVEGAGGEIIAVSANAEGVRVEKVI